MLMCVVMCFTDAKIYSISPLAITRIKSKDDVAEMTTTPGLSTEATGPSHPSLTVAFTLKVRFC